MLTADTTPVRRSPCRRRCDWPCASATRCCRPACRPTTSWSSSFAWPTPTGYAASMSMSRTPRSRCPTIRLRTSRPSRRIRVVRPTVVDYTKVRLLNRLAADIEAGLPVTRRRPRSNASGRRRTRTRAWVRMVGNAGVGSAATLLFSTNWKIIAADVPHRMHWCICCSAAFERRRVPPFFQQLAAAATHHAHRRRHHVRRGPLGHVLRRRRPDPARRRRHHHARRRNDDRRRRAGRGRPVLRHGVGAGVRGHLRTAGIVAGIVIALRLAQRIGAPLTLSAEPFDVRSGRRSSSSGPA